MSVVKPFILISVVLTLFSSLLFAADSPTYRGSVGQSGSAEAIAVPPALAWRWMGVKETPGNQSSPAVVGNRIFFGSGPRLICMDAETGSVVWTYPNEGNASGNFKTAPTVSNGLVIVGNTDGNVYAFTAKEGKLRWIARANVSTHIVAVNDRVYFGTNDGYLYGLDIKSGDSIYGKTPFKASAAISSTPIVSDNLIILVSDDGVIYGVISASGKAKWAQRLPSSSSDIIPIMSGGSVYVAVNNILYALNNASGQVRWSQTFANEIVMTPTADSKNVFVVTNEDYLYALTSTGKLAWKKSVKLPFAQSAPGVVSGKYIIIPCRRGVLAAFDTTTGEKKWQYTMKPLPTNIIPTSTPLNRPDYITTVAAPVIANGSLYVLTEDGGLLAFNNEGIDLTPPSLAALLPEPGFRMPGKPPLEVYARLEDEGTGINPDSVKLFVDDNPLVGEFDPVRGTYYYKFALSDTNKPWEDGRRTLKLIAFDWAGNKLEKIWTVLVDNNLRAAAKKPYMGLEPGTGPSGTGGPGKPGGPGMPGGPGKPGGPGMPGGPAGPIPGGPVR